MLKIKIPPRSEHAKTDQQPVTEAITPIAEFWAWWQKEFDEPEDLMEFDVGDFRRQFSFLRFSRIMSGLISR